MMYSVEVRMPPVTRSTPVVVVLACFDRLLSTSPWGLIVFLLLGFTAGVVNVMRSAGVMAKQSERL